MKLRPRRPLSLLTKFSLVAFVITAAIALTLAWGIQWQMEKHFLRQEAMDAADQIHTILSSNLEAADLAGPLKSSRFEVLDYLIQENLLSQHIISIKIWNNQGLLLYSDQKELIGRRFPINKELKEALEGRIVTELSSPKKKANKGGEDRFDQIMDIYVPLRAKKSPQILGAYEIAHDVGVVQPFIDSMQRFIWVVFTFGFLVLYGSLFMLVRNASRELIHSDKENARLYLEAERRLKNLQALHEIDQAISANFDLPHTLNAVLTQVTGQLQVDAACVLLLKPTRQTLEYAAGRGFRTQGIESSSLRVGEGYAGRAALEHRTLSISNLPKQGEEFLRLPLLAGEDFISYYASPLIAKGQVKGVLEIFQRGFLHPSSEWLDFLEALATQAAIAIDNTTLFEDLQRSNVELILAYDATLEGWSRALDLRDKEILGHTQRVTTLTLKIAQVMGVSDAEMVHIRRGALLHDIGKMAIPDNILFKSGPLSEEEWKIMRQHPVHAYEMISPIAFLRPALDIPYCHHEKWDGSGYPRGLKGEQIPLAARIFAVVDTWDALSSDRPYRPAWKQEQVYAYISRQAGKHFDPQVVKIFEKELNLNKS